MVVILTSPSFQHEGPIPSRFTCEGDDCSPSLEWRGIPGETKSLALLVEDPDAPDPEAPRRTFTHWVVYNLPPDVTGLAEALEEAPSHADFGLNDFGKTKYRGPCPPVGRHRYYFRLFALDTTLELTRPRRDELLAAIEGHVIDEGVLIGTYQKQADR